MHIRAVSAVVIGGIIAGAVVAAPAAAQAGQIVIESTQVGEPMMNPMMGGPRQMKTGAGRILGRVISTDTGAPLRRAQVRLTAPEIGVKTSLTDAEGRFEFRELPAGRFSLNASKSGYVSVQFGQTRPFESGRPIELADKQVLDKADISMPRGGVISGRIVDEFGDPVPDALVSAMRQTWANGRRRLTPSGRTSQTNDLGQFRLYGLPPGDYYVSASLRSTDIMMLDPALLTGGGSGASGSTPASGYAATYFPGTTTAANAQRITVAVAQEAQNTDFALAPVRLARISGTVMTSDGKPLDGAMVSASPAGRGELGFAMLNQATGRTSKEGNFTLSSLAPGDYTVAVRSLRVITSDTGDTMMVRATLGGGEGAESETAAVPLTVAGEDLSNVVIITSKGGTASGRLTFEGAATPPVSTGVRITAAPADLEGPPFAAPGGASTTKEDGTFVLRGLAGRRIIRAGNLPSGWTLKSVRLDGDDVTDSGIEFRPGQDVSGLELVVTSKQTEVTGTAAASNGSPIKDYTVVLFSTDSQHWNLPMTRWVNGTRPDQEGRFRVRNIPPGSYNIVAVDYIEAGAWGDPELLERLKVRARRITVAEGGSEKLELKLTDQY